MFIFENKAVPLETQFRDIAIDYLQRKIFKKNGKIKLLPVKAKCVNQKAKYNEVSS
jgi:hypothetical protein